VTQAVFPIRHPLADFESDHGREEEKSYHGNL
jgi:hypothetical protein